MSNPLLSANYFPPFDEIKPEHFQPAFEKIFADIEVEYQKLRDNPEPPTFANTVVPFDKLFADYGRVARALGVFYANAKTPEIPGIVEQSSLAVDALQKKIFQDQKLATRFKTIYDQKDRLSLDDQDRWFLQNLYWDFEGNGAFLDAAGQKALLETDAELIKKAQACYDNIMDHGRKQQAFLLTDPAELSGVPEATKAVFAKQAREQAREAGHTEGWLFIPERLLVDELLEVADSREFRQKMHETMNRVGTQAPYDNEPLLKEVQRLRDARTLLLVDEATGQPKYKNFADYQQSRNMAGSVQKVEDIFAESIGQLLPRYESDMQTLEAWTALQPGGPQKLEPWDVPYYAAKYRKEELSYDSEKLKPHLELENVISGWLQHASKDMNMDFIPASHPTWHPDVRTYDVYDRDTGQMGLLYIDPYARPGQKAGGAWMDEVQSGHEDRVNAIVFNMNLTKPEPGQKVYVDPGQVETFYHEGGHGLNGLKGQPPKYSTRRGTGNGSAYVEIHSTMQERVPYTPEVLPTYAFDAAGRLPDPSLIAAKKKAEDFLATREVLKMIQNARRDLLLHSISASEYTTAADIEKNADLDSPYSAHVRSYPLLRFDHLVGGALSQYAAGYCGYYLANVAQAQASEPFLTAGLYDPALLEKKRAFYAVGASLESNKAYEGFTGKPLRDISPYMRTLGIDPGKKPLLPAPDFAPRPAV